MLNDKVYMDLYLNFSTLKTGTMVLSNNLKYELTYTSNKYTTENPDNLVVITCVFTYKIHYFKLNNGPTKKPSENVVVSCRQCCITHKCCNIS